MIATNNTPPPNAETEPPLTPDEVLRKLRGDGQPLAFVNLAVRVAGSADDIRQFVNWIIGRERPPRPLPPPPSLSEWMGLYRNHRAMFDGMARAFEWSDEVPVNAMFDGLRGAGCVPQDQWKAIVSELTNEDLNALILPFRGIPFPPDDATLRLMLEDIEKQAAFEDDTEAKMIDAMMACPAGQYFFRVWWPCLMLHRTYPTRLLRRARSGDLDALDKLLRLDKSIIHELRIAERVHQIMHAGTRLEQRQIANALGGRPKGRLDQRAIRYGFLGLISQFALLFKAKVTAPDIRALFDGVARVKRGRRTDPLIPAGETLTKAVARNRNWASLPRR